MAEKTKETPAVKLPEQPAAPVAQVGQGLPVLTTAVAPAPRGVFDEINRLEKSQGRSRQGGGERHTFGAWCRAKGVRTERVRDLLREGKLDIGNATGDGPEMTEAEFDRAVDFQYKGSFGAAPGLQVHVSAEQARGGGPVPGEGEGDVLASSPEALASRKESEAAARKV
jgi:hypothetical protein